MVEQLNTDHNDMVYQLKHVFDEYCGGKGDMEGKSFQKMCKDTKLIDKKLDGTSVDLIFAKSKDKSERRINFD